MPPQKVLVAMSGGVDSSVAALLLREQGFHVVGVTMCLGITDQLGDAQCCGPQAIKDARKVCDTLEMPHYVMDYSKQLHTDIICDFVEQYKNGRTPNPCVRCNQFLKFGSLYNYARSCGFDYMATGHYAGIGSFNGMSVLKRHKDNKKDQSYFLYSIPSETLDHVLFPLFDLDKPQVRAIAQKANLPVFSKPESQEICFVPNDDYRSYLKKYHSINGEPGLFIDIKGKVLGTHKGIVNYTVGQRKGLGIAMGEPLYVVSINKEDNSIMLGKRSALKSRVLLAGNVNLFMEQIPAQLTSKIRYSQSEKPCKAQLLNDMLRVEFQEEQEAVTPGQSVVLYHDDYVVGGGIIESVI